MLIITLEQGIHTEEEETPFQNVSDRPVGVRPVGLGGGHDKQDRGICEM